MQENSRIPTSVQLIIHSGMGAILGSLLGFALIFSDKNIFHFIATSSSPLMETAVFIGFLSFVMGIGATLTGFFFTAIELNALAKQEAKRVIQRHPDNRR